MEKIRDLYKYSRRELQYLAKKYNIKANSKSIVIIKKLEDKIKELEEKKNQSNKEQSPIENKTQNLPYLPSELTRKIFTKKIKLEELDKYNITMIKEAMDIDNYLKSKLNKKFSYYKFGHNINNYYKNFFYINDLDYLKIIKKHKIHYNDNENIIQKKIEPLIIEIIIILEQYTFLLDNLEDLDEFYDSYEFEYNETELDEKRYHEQINEKINLLNTKMKELNKLGFIINIKYIEKINDLINKINNHPNNIKQINNFLKIYKVLTSSSRSNSSTRKRSK